jgi:exopolysaccharide biosynthesis polyprenyl glycosylphosphotransferase
VTQAATDSLVVGDPGERLAPVAFDPAAAADSEDHALARVWARRLELVGAWLVWLFDLAGAALAWQIAFVVRLALVPQLGPMISFTSGSAVPEWFPQVLFLGLYSLALYANGCLNSERPVWVLPRQMVAAFGALVLFLGTSYLFKWLTFSRAFLGLLGLTLIGIIVLEWLVLRLTRSVIRRWGLGVRSVLVVGDPESSAWVLEDLERSANAGVRPLGLVTDAANGSGSLPPGTRTFPSIARAASWASRLRADQVVLCLPKWPYARLAPLIESLGRAGVRVYLQRPELSVHLGIYEEPQNLFRGTELIDFGDPRPRRIRPALKRAFDVIVGGVLFVLALPVFAAIGLAILIQDGRPVLYRQERCGRNGLRFMIWKFRTMTIGADAQQAELEPLNEASGPIFKIRNDPRVTPLGRFLRRHSLDELPQLWNVMCGQMSLVGPRPPLPAEVERYEPWHRSRLSGVIGCSGLWQVSGRSNLPFDEMAMLDLYYLRHMSLRLDTKILARTMWIVLVGEGAY